MQELLSRLIESDRSIRNCSLSVEKADGSFSWSGAAGVTQDGQMPMTKDTPIYIASVTKLYTATVIMRLYEMGSLSLGDPMTKFLPENLIGGIHVFKGTDYTGQISVEQLLSHTSGIPDYYSEKAKDGKSLFELSVENPDRIWTADETIERARKEMTPNFPPGTNASYSDTNYQLLGKIIEVITGKPLEAAYQDVIFAPLGLHHTWLVGHLEGQPAQVGMPADVFYKGANITKVRANAHIGLTGVWSPRRRK